MYRCGCTYRVTLRVFSWGTLQQQQHLFYFQSTTIIIFMLKAKVSVLIASFILYTLFNTLCHPFSGSLGRLTWVRLQQPQEQCYPVLQVHAGTFHVFVIHQTLTWTTGSLTCVIIIPMRVYTHGSGPPTVSQQNIFWLGKTLTNIFCSPDTVRTLGLWISSPMLYHLSHPVMAEVIHLIVVFTLHGGLDFRLLWHNLGCWNTPTIPCTYVAGPSCVQSHLE